MTKFVLSPPLVFVLVYSVFGLYFLFYNPLFQGPDEINHFYRSYAVSTGELEPNTTIDRRGGQIPISFKQAVDSFSYLKWYANQKTSPDRHRPFAYRTIAPGATVFVDYPNTALYPALVYLPQAFGIAVARAANCSVLTALWLTRFCGLLFGLLAGLAALRRLPAFRWLFCVLLLLPMTVYTQATISADTVTNGISFITLAYLLHLILRQPHIGWKQLAAVLLLATLIASTKLFYVPLLGLAVLIPRTKFRMGIGKWGSAALVLATIIACLAFWSGRIDRIYLPYSQYAEAHRSGLDLPQWTDAHRQRELILAEPRRIPLAALRSLQTGFNMYSRSYIGTLGNLDTFLPIPVIIFGYLGILFTAFFDPVSRFTFKWPAKLFLFALLASCWALVILSQLLSWESVGSTAVHVIQGRYLVPFAPLLFLLFHRKSDGLSGRYYRWGAVLFSVSLLTISAVVMHRRYYQYPNTGAVTAITCDLETQWDQYYLAAGDYPALLDFANETRSTEQARSGRHSAKLSGQGFGYGLSYHLFDCNPGDTLRAVVWRRGPVGNLMVTSRDDGLIQYAGSLTGVTEGAWQQFGLELVLPATFEAGRSISCFVMNLDSIPAYFDDFSVSYHRAASDG